MAMGAIRVDFLSPCAQRKSTRFSWLLSGNDKKLNITILAPFFYLWIILCVKL